MNSIGIQTRLAGFSTMLQGGKWCRQNIRCIMFQVRKFCQPFKVDIGNYGFLYGFPKIVIWNFIIFLFLHYQTKNDWQQAKKATNLTNEWRSTSLLEGYEVNIGYDSRLASVISTIKVKGELSK